MPKIVKANTVESGTVCHRLPWISARLFGIAAWHDIRAKAIEVPAHVGHAPPEINSHAAGQHYHRRRVTIGRRRSPTSTEQGWVTVWVSRHFQPKD